ncbi:catabolite control protein A [Peptococcaceae bacterium CEB3]|nr:catabolite control protein A [Peptococcaceae bacterium CEB3]
MKRVTIKDIAEKLNVSRGTVDRVLHKRGGVNPETEALILEAVKRLDYQPDRIARALVKKDRYTIGFIVPRTPMSFWGQVIFGAETAARELSDFGVEVKFYFSEIRDGFRERTLLEGALNDGVAGIAITPTDPHLVRALIDNASEAGIPVVTFNTDVPDSKRLGYVGLDGYLGGRVAGELMYKFLDGAGEVGVLTGFLSTQDTEARRKGFLEVVGSMGKENMTTVGTWENADDSGKCYEVTGKIIHDHPDLRGIFVTNSCTAAVGAAIVDQHREGKIKLIGFDVNEEVSRLLKNNIVTACITQNSFQQGYQPIRILFDYLQAGFKPKHPYILSRPEVVLIEMLNGEGGLPRH